VLEGVSLSLRSCRDVIREGGLDVVHPTFSGGGLGSPLWRTILASTLGSRGSIVEPQGPAIGAALLAAATVGVAPCAAGEPVARVRRQQITPREDWIRPYDELYRIYQDAVASLSPPSHALTAFARRHTLRRVPNRARGPEPAPPSPR
jgi:sugar (pentulose or hexulose) kinase